MTPEAERLFHQLANLGVEARCAVLDGPQIAAADRREVEELLAYDAPGTEGSQLTAHVADAALWAIESGGMPPGSRCGRHRLVKLLGAGGMGAVFLAEREKGDVAQRVAVKFLNTAFTGGRLEQQLLSERRLVALLVHPNIARFLDSGTLESGQPYLVMEYVDGQPIDRHCAEMPWPEVLRIFGKVCEAAAYAHANLIVHRDLKPGNILVTPDGEPKLIDFGVGTLLDFEKRHTDTATRMFTPAYASPEQLLGNPVGMAADVYGLGATLYHLLAGRPPFDSAASHADIAAREPVPLHTIGKGFPRDLSHIVARAMCPDPAQRYGSVAHLAADLDALTASRPVSASRFLSKASVTSPRPRMAESRNALDGNVVDALGRRTEEALARLSPLARRVVAVAAMLGTDTTTIEIAAVSDASTAMVREALSSAAGLGLLQGTSSLTVTFAHELVRLAALAMITHSERLDLHARAAMVLAGNDAPQMLRRTHHALEAASRSIVDHESALRMARKTARALRPAGSLEAAAGLFSRALNVSSAPGLQIPASPLTVEYAESVLACGRLAEARALFDRAARLADSEEDSRSLARAAVGLGGIWLGEHRLAGETARVSGLQRRALAALPAVADVLRARLRARLVAEDAYRGGSMNLAETAVDAVRSTRDAHARAEALSLYHHLLTGPERSAQRLSIAEELIASAAEAEDVLLSLVGLCWRAADLFRLGDARAPTAHGELRVRAEALQCRSILFTVRAMEVMLTLRAGRLDEAEAAADACYAMGVEVGDVDALAYYGGQLAAIRVFQGREAELAGFVASIAASPTLIPQREHSFALAEGLFALRAGRPSLAQSQLEQIAREGIGSLSRSSSWLTSMLATVELAAALRHTAVARAAYEALLPYAELPVMASLLAVVCFGSTHRLLGVAASTCGEHDRAVEHLAAAVTASERLGHRPAAIQAQAELGLALVERGRGNDARRGDALVDEAVGAAEALGMGVLAGRWRGALTSGGRPQR